MESYRHTQIGWLLLTALGGGASIAGGTAVVLALLGYAAWVPACVAFLLALSCVLFGTLRVTVSGRGGEVRLRFGIGLIGKSFFLSDICKAATVRNHWYYGWGIRYTPQGWLYNVSGLDAVEITLTSGRRYRIGTDQPQQLCAAIQSVLNR